jgi:predicted glycosyltransferase
LSRRRIFVYVQHLLGIGHLRRAATLANAMAARGSEVTLASGGLPVPDLQMHGVRLVQLPPASAADATFKVLVQPDGKPVTEEWKARRQTALLEAWREADASALIVELYPFGRRQMRFELLPLLDAASAAIPRPVIVSSVRDVLGNGQNKPEREEQMIEIFERYFDHVVVHADPHLTSFGGSFKNAGRISSKLHYTGFVVDRTALFPATQSGTERVGHREVLVSAGGGAVGSPLLETAILARPLSRLKDRVWRVLSGVNASEGSIASLSALASRTGEGRVIVERTRPDFQACLAGCAVSVSQGGYNTMMEIIQARARAVVVPFSGSNETEQASRVRQFAARGLLDFVEEDVLTPESLAAAIDRAAQRERPPPGAIDLTGAERTAELVETWLTELTS